MTGKPPDDDAVARSKRATERQREEKRFWLEGIRPASKKPSRRQKGSRGSKVKPADFEANAVQLLADWYRRDIIGHSMLKAGNRFNSELASAHEPSIQAMDLVRVRVDVSIKPRRGLQGANNLASLVAVQEALEAVGGADSMMASVLFHVVGREQSFRQWCALDGRCSNHRVAPGLLLGGLELLARHYGLQRSHKKA